MCLLIKDDLLGEAYCLCIAVFTLDFCESGYMFKLVR